MELNDKSSVLDDIILLEKLSVEDEAKEVEDSADVTGAAKESDKPDIAIAIDDDNDDDDADVKSSDEE